MATPPPLDDLPRASAKELSHEDVMKRWVAAWEYEKENIECAYDDLRFRAGEQQWTDDIRKARDSRPCLTFNRMGQFVRNVTGEIRQMRPSIKVVPAGEGSDEETAERRGGIIRYIENRSNAEKAVYARAADSQVTCGIGHWEVFIEYASGSTFEQELGVRLVDDQVAVLWDADARDPTRNDAIYCFNQVDPTKAAYKDAYPDHPISDIEIPGNYARHWFGDDRVRIARYWYKVETSRRFMAMPDAGYVALDETMPPADIEAMLVSGGEIVVRKSHKIRWVMMNGMEFLGEPKDWPGPYIPIVPVIGEEIRIGSRVVRHGVVRFAVDPQRAYNYARSTQTEFVGLQPKSPYMATPENIRGHEHLYDTANVKNHPVMLYNPDPRNGGKEPSRSMPPQSSSGLTECIMMAEQDMQAVTGIYNASLGARSNETSGVAIKRRELQGDTGTVVYATNYSLSIAHTGRIFNSLLPYVYNEPGRVARIVGQDGKERIERLNQPAGLVIDGVAPPRINDVTVGAYDIVMEMGPSYATKKEEARDGMTAFIQAFPPAGPLIGDLVAKAQDWPNAEEVADRLFHVLPPQLQAEIAQKSGDPSKMPPQPPPPDPVMQAQAEAEMAKAVSEKTKAEAEVAKVEFETQLQTLKLRQQELTNIAAEFGVLDAQMKLAANGMPVDPNWHQQVSDALSVLNEAVAEQVNGMAGDNPLPPIEDIIPAGLEAGGEQMPVSHDAGLTGVPSP